MKTIVCEFWLGDKDVCVIKYKADFLKFTVDEANKTIKLYNVWNEEDTCTDVDITFSNMLDFKDAVLHLGAAINAIEANISFEDTYIVTEAE